MKTENKLFQISDKYHIEQMDARNWVLRIKQDQKEQSIDNDTKDSVAQAGTDDKAKKWPGWKAIGYYSLLQNAKEEVVELCAKDSADYKELMKWCDAIAKAKIA